ncbi:MAG TPA: PP2C family protein-serine/threonine phosphatase [Nocardioidaceae bacterium]
MTRDKSQVVGAALATLWLVSFTLVDLLAPDTAVLSPLFALAPLIASAVLPGGPTAVFAALAVLLSVGSGWWNDAWGEPQQLVRVLDVTLVSLAAVIVAVVRVRREHRHERVSAIAEVAQRTILPVLPRQVGEVEVGVRYLSAAQDAVVGGDLYDCYHSDAHVRFLVGDVRGKGIAAVEQAARVIRAFRQAAATHVTLAGVAQEMSLYLERFFDDEEFVTALLVDTTDRGRLTLVSCGHPPPLLVRPDGSALFVDLPAGLPLGLGESYESRTVGWDVGSRLLMYTDGVSEARDRAGTFLPVPSLAGVLRSGRVDEALDGVLDTVRRYVPGGRLNDDLAVVLLERETAAEAAPTDPTELAQLGLEGPDGSEPATSSDVG